MADWAPDGMSLAVIRRSGEIWAVEYPVGNVVWKTSSSAPLAFRVSPEGKRIAMAQYYDGSSVAIAIIDTSGGKASTKILGRVSDQNPNRIDPIVSWSPDGREVLFRSFDPNEWGTIYAMNMKGERRVVTRAPGHLTLYDVASDGRMLIRTDNRMEGILAMAPGQNEEIDLTCLDASSLAGLSSDGSVIAASVGGESGGAKGSVYLRKTDGSPPVRLGDGAAWALAPDGKWVSAFTSVDKATRRYVLLPAGAGEEQVISIPQFKGVNIVFGWRPNGDLLVFGPAKTRGYQNVVWNRQSGALSPIGPEGQADLVPAVSPDTRRILTAGPDGKWWTYPVDGGEGSPVKGLSSHDVPLDWRADNKSIYFTTHHDENRMLHVSILDLDSGSRTPWKEIHPSRPVEQILRLRITPDGRAYAYNYLVKSSDLYVASPAKR
jgi:Tol biopolymer transport system component